jgi:hypothetical protein
VTLEVGLTTAISDVDQVIARCKELDVSLVTLRTESLPGYKECQAPDLPALRETEQKLADAGVTIASLIQWFGSDADLVLNPTAPGAKWMECSGHWKWRGNSG